MQSTSNIKSSILVLLFAVIFSLSTFEFWQTWKRGKSTPFHWDVELYYSYLPATFIYHDLSFNYSDTLPMQRLENGNKNPKYTCGMAIMYAPFFLMGHKIAINQKNKLDGYSEPYATMIHFGSIFYVMLGLFFLRKVLLRFYNEHLTALLLLIAFFGTNLFHYTLREGEYSHGYLFCLVSIFLFLTIKWHDKPKYSTSIRLGLIIGLITLIRPTDCLIFIAFIFYNIINKETFKNKIQFFLIHKWKFLIIFLFGLIMLSPQIIFWKIHMDSFLFFSYNNEGFFWGDPKMWEVLFSYRKGWLIYTPIMIFSLIGIFFMKKHAPQFMFAIILFFILNLYVISCWWCWWYGGSFGMRPMIDSYPLMLIALGAFLKQIYYKSSKINWLSNIKKYSVFICITYFICLNLIQTYQCNVYMMHFDSMNKEVYWQIFGKFEFNTEQDHALYYKSLSKIDYDKALDGSNRNDY